MDIALIGIGLALLSSVTTAVAHGLLKAGKDKLAVRALIGATGAAAMGPFCLFVPLPTPIMLPWLATASVLHVVYQLVLIRSYASNDFAVAYPIARGAAPIATALLGLLLLGDRVSLLGLLGIAPVSAGILLIAIGRSIARQGLIVAMIAGLLATTYTVVDAHAIRLAPRPMTFVAWYFVLDGCWMFPIFAIARRGSVISLLRAEGRVGLLAGMMTLVCFGSALLALRFTPVGIVSALRETSIVFAMAIAALGLKERINRRHLIGAIVIVLGAVLVVSIAR